MHRVHDAYMDGASTVRKHGETVMARTITLETLRERLEARRLEAWATTHHVCETCGGITDTAAAAATCVAAGDPVPDGKYHRARSAQQTARKVRNAGYIARGLAAEEAADIFGE